MKNYIPTINVSSLLNSDFNSKSAINAIKKIENACKNNNIKVGIHCLSPSYLKDKLFNGYDLGTLASDVRIYAEGLSNKIKEARS